MADMGDTEKMADEAMASLRTLLTESREAHSRQIAPLYERLRMLGAPHGENEHEYARGIRRQITQFLQAQHEREAPIIAQIVRIESLRLRPVVISLLREIRDLLRRNQGA